MNGYQQYLPILEKALGDLDGWRSEFGGTPAEPGVDSSNSEIAEVMKLLRERLKGNYPFHHPQYAGQMLKPPHPIAWLAYSLAATINPNNHALDGGPPTSEMEKESVSLLAQMVGYGDQSLGHLTSGGTVANLEALFVAREIHPDKKIAASSQAHYTHRRMCRVLNTPFLEVPLDEKGFPDLDFLEKHRDDIGTLVVTMGTTGLGAVEPLADLYEWAKSRSVRLHVDAAYGGFFKIISDQLRSKSHWNFLHFADSIVIDPHKHGLQPYGCGCVLFKDPAVGKFYSHDSPYTYFTSDDLHLGEISLECSRAGASAAAFWATLKLLPLTKEGLGSILSKTIFAAQNFASSISESDKFTLFSPPELDIVGYFPGNEKSSLSDITRQSKQLFKDGAADKTHGFHLSLYSLSAAEILSVFPDADADADSVTILRSVFMKPEHLNFIPELVDRLHKKLAEQAG